MSTILKIFKQHLLRPSWKSSIFICPWTVSRIEWKWWKASGHHGGLELLKWFRSYPRWPPWQPSSNHICYWTVSLIELKHDGRHWGVMLKSICSNVQDGHHLEILQTTSPSKSKSGWGVTWWEASGWHADSELLHCSVSISKMAAMMAILKLFKQCQILNC